MVMSRSHLFPTFRHGGQTAMQETVACQHTMRLDIATASSTHEVDDDDKLVMLDINEKSQTQISAMFGRKTSRRHKNPAATLQAAFQAYAGEIRNC